MLALLLLSLYPWHTTATPSSCDTQYASCPAETTFAASFARWWDILHPPHIVAAGDVMLSRSVGANLKKSGSTYITDTYNPFGDSASGAIVLLNLESPFADADRDVNEPTFYFASNPDNIAVLAWLAQNRTLVVSLANNHMANAGYAGFATTIESLDAAGILHTGLSRDERTGYIVLDRAERRYCIGGYVYDGNVYHDRTHGVTWHISSLDDAITDIEKMNQEHCDEKIFLLHWGAEYRTEPTAAQQNLAHTLIDRGATLIIGSHSHVFWKTEQYQGKWIFYSLGNAIFDQEWWRNGCLTGMDCITDEFLQKSVVPTYIGTAVELSYPYTNDYAKWQWDITYGKMSKR